jgi:CDP-diacylglycerol--glycerol-3-phosphate 3-phosphatidyltransferase
MLLSVRLLACRISKAFATMNLPNSITMSRIACVPLLIWILSPAFPLQGGHGAVGLRGGEQEIIASLVFIMASITDGLDGYLARRRGQITTMGMLLDPLADKLMVSAAYIVLVAYNPRIVPPWIAVLVIGREFLVSGLRSIAAAEGFTIEASEIGKLKTVIQIVSVVAAILAHRWDYWNWGGFIVAVHFIAVTAIYWMATVSIISAVDYFVGFWKKIDHASDRRRKKRSFVLSRKQKPAPPAPEHPSRIVWPPRGIYSVSYL